MVLMTRAPHAMQNRAVVYGWPGMVKADFIGERRLIIKIQAAVSIQKVASMEMT
jgi:hypothetical protein